MLKSARKGKRWQGESPTKSNDLSLYSTQQALCLRSEEWTLTLLHKTRRNTKHLWFAYSGFAFYMYQKLPDTTTSFALREHRLLSTSLKHLGAIHNFLSFHLLWHHQFGSYKAGWAEKMHPVESQYCLHPAICILFCFIQRFPLGSPDSPIKPPEMKWREKKKSFNQCLF